MNKKLNFYAIISTYIGTAFGAGFVSGQELLQFFLCDTTAGIKGTIIMSVGVLILSFIVMKGNYYYQTSHYEKLIVGESPILRKIIVFTFYMFSFGIIIIMFAGAGALLNSLFGIPNIYGSIIMALIVLTIGLSGPEGIIKSFKLLVPVMFVIAIITSLMGITLNADTFSENIVTVKCQGNNWLFSAILYLTYCYYLMIAVLTYLGKDARSIKDIAIGSIGSALGLALSSSLIVLAMRHNLGSIVDAELPMVAVAQNVSPLMGNAYALVLFGGLLSASIGTLYALLNMLENSSNKYLKNKKYTVPIMCIIALLFSNFGFSNLISVVYPIMGYFGIVAIIGVIIQHFRIMKSHK